MGSTLVGLYLKRGRSGASTCVQIPLMGGIACLGTGNSWEGPFLQNWRGPQCQSTRIQKINAMVNTVSQLCN